MRGPFLWIAAAHLFLASAGLAQGTEGVVTIGTYRRYLDEPAAATFGGAVKIPLAGRFSVRPEFLVDNGRDYQSLLLLGTVMGDFTNPQRSIVGYWIASGGWVSTKEVAFSQRCWYPAALGGVGMRVAIREKWFSAAEFRAGIPAFPLLTFQVGYRFGTRRASRP